MNPTSTPMPALSLMGVTTLADWSKLPASIRRRTARAAAKFPYVDSPRSRWERAAVAAAKGGAR
jgi:hypothetical protein